MSNDNFYRFQIEMFSNFLDNKLRSKKKKKKKKKSVVMWVFGYPSKLLALSNF